MVVFFTELCYCENDTCNLVVQVMVALKRGDLTANPGDFGNLRGKDELKFFLDSLLPEDN